MGLFDFLRRPASAQPVRTPAVALNLRAVEAIRHGDRQSAIALLVEAREADAASPNAVVTIGNLLLEDGQIDDAIVHYEHALVLDDRYAPAYHNLGVALHRSGRRREAVYNLKKATKLEARIIR